MIPFNKTLIVASFASFKSPEIYWINFEINISFFPAKISIYFIYNFFFDSSLNIFSICSKISFISFINPISIYSLKHLFVISLNFSFCPFEIFNNSKNFCWRLFIIFFSLSLKLIIWNIIFKSSNLLILFIIPFIKSIYSSFGKMSWNFIFLLNNSKKLSIVSLFDFSNSSKSILSKINLVFFNLSISSFLFFG